MTLTEGSPSSSVAGRRVGYLVGAAVNAALLYLVNIRPGWRALPFLTEEMVDVLGLVNLSLASAAIAQLIYLSVDPPWLRALGDIVTTGIGLAVLVRMLQVFPFEFAGDIPWASVVRVALVVAAALGAVAVVVALVKLFREIARLTGRQARGPSGDSRPLTKADR